MTLVECFAFMGRRVELVMKCQRWDQNVRSCKRYPNIFGRSSVRCRRCSRQVGPHSFGPVVAATDQEPVRITIPVRYGLSKSYRETSVCVREYQPGHTLCGFGVDGYETSQSLVTGVSTGFWGEWWRLLPISFNLLTSLIMFLYISCLANKDRVSFNCFETE
jgi:hypothetical protein